MLSLLQIKNTLTAKSDEKQTMQCTRWLALDPAGRNQLKESLCKSLATENVQVGRQAAQAIAAIGIIEIPKYVARIFDAC